MLIMNIAAEENTPKNITVPGNKALPLIIKTNNTIATPDAEAWKNIISCHVASVL